MHVARITPNPKVDKMKNTVEVTEVAEAKAIVQNLQSWLNEAVHERSTAINRCFSFFKIGAGLKFILIFYKLYIQGKE